MAGANSHEQGVSIPIRGSCQTSQRNSLAESKPERDSVTASNLERYSAITHEREPVPVRRPLQLLDIPRLFASTQEAHTRWQRRTNLWGLGLRRSRHRRRQLRRL